MIASVRRLLRFWFTFEEPVPRGPFLRHGLLLVLLKYAGDATIVWLGAGTFWTPFDYLQSVPFLLSSRLGEAAGYVAPMLALWTLPFLWIGVTMTVRRLLDAGRSAWWSLLFFVPLVSYALLLVLTALPSSRSRPSARPEPGGERLPSALLAMAFGASLGLGLLWLGVRWIESYGLAVFMGTPFVLGLATAYVLRRRYPATLKDTLEVVAMTLVLLAGAAFAVGFEGAVCLLMTAPLALAVALLGGVVGRHLASIGERPAHGAVLLLLLMPGTLALEARGPAATVREVRTSVIVNAPTDAVWHQVIAFSPIPQPSSLLFRLGLAYPVSAEIKGSGVGAVRSCVFSTGTFVEPITAWEAGHRLAFDVAESPDPLRELSPWNASPPHLQGWLVSRRGEFRLEAMEGGRTRLEGSTWYEQRLRPEGYWVVFSDYVIGQIHRRVLEHIKREVERPALNTLAVER